MQAAAAVSGGPLESHGSIRGRGGIMAHSEVTLLEGESREPLVRAHGAFARFMKLEPAEDGSSADTGTLKSEKYRGDVSVLRDA